MEPERKIEKLLRAYAKKRRADAGDPLKLHPANRRLLQNEAGRRVPATGAGDVGNLFLLLLAVFRRRLMFALCIVAVAFLGASMFLPALSKAKKRAQTANAVNNLKQIAQAANLFESESNRLPTSLDEIKGQLVSDKVLIDPQSGKPFVYAGLLSNGVVAYSPVNKDGRASVVFMDGHVETVTAEHFAELTKQKSTELALADKFTRERLVNENAKMPVAAATPAPALPPASELETAGIPAQSRSFDRLTAQTNSVQPVLTASQNFVQAGESNLQNLYRNDSASARTAPVLQSFQMRQNGDAISVVDRDGSVYQGSVQLANATTRNEPIPAGSLVAPGTPPQSQAKVAQLAGNEQQAVQNYFFRVAGTNRTLKQNVVFTGNLLANGSAPQTAQTGNSFGGVGGGGGGGAGGGNQLQPAATNASQQLLMSNSRIVGTAVIASTNQIEINAVPVTQ